MDLSILIETLAEDGIISQKTRGWLEPLWQRELVEAKALEDDDAKFGRTIFDEDGGDGGGGDGEQANEASVSYLCKVQLPPSLEIKTLCFDGRINGSTGKGAPRATTKFRYCIDVTQCGTGHGNVVWPASIATCMYLQQQEQNLFFDARHDDGGTPAGTCGASSLAPQRERRRVQRVLELGAGAAIPSLFLAASRAAAITRQTQPQQLPPSPPPATLLIHVTDARSYRNIRQILASVAVALQQQQQQQGDGTEKGNTIASSLSEAAVQFLVSPHDWGTGDLEEACDGVGHGGGYDLIVASDCIYNPNYHEQLLDSICRALRKPARTAAAAAAAADAASASSGDLPQKRPSLFDGDCGGGKAIVAFSLHRNTDDDNVWDFFRKAEKRKIEVAAAPPIADLEAVADEESPTRATTAKQKHWEQQNERVDRSVAMSFYLASRPALAGAGKEGVAASETSDKEGCTGGRSRFCWNMEQKMKDLGLWKANMDPERWDAYVYELAWTPTGTVA